MIHFRAATLIAFAALLGAGCASKTEVQPAQLTNVRARKDAKG